jgi:hypothetical protein
MKSLVVVISIGFGVLLSLVAWLLALGGTASFQKDNDVPRDCVGFAWWAVCAQFVIYAIMGIVYIMQWRGNKSVVSLMTPAFTVWITIITVIDMIVANTMIITLCDHMNMSQMHHMMDIMSMPGSPPLIAASIGFVLLAIQNAIVATTLSIMSRDKTTGSSSEYDQFTSSKV